jgi:formylglycine-generating enzyme required for sulfatase activity
MFVRLFFILILFSFLPLSISQKAMAGNDQSESVMAQPVMPLRSTPPLESFPVVESLKAWKETLSGMEFVRVDGGCFTMGCGVWDVDCRGREQPEHEVCVNGFWIGKFEVTQGEWKNLMGSNLSLHKLSDHHPADRISWYDAQDIIERLNSRKYGLRFRLPTEAEWEFAARSSGGPNPFSGGNTADEAAWYLNNSGDMPHPVGTKGANNLGIYDMSGNVREWVEDWYAPEYYMSSPKQNPQGPLGGTMRVSRGGFWSSSNYSVRTTSRAWNDPKVRTPGQGIRLVAVPFP